MTKNTFCLLALAGLVSASAANAVSLNPKGIGQVLIYPYYTVNESQDTLISVVNMSDVGKAVQVRFSEAYNGRDALVFRLYIAAHDVWTASVSQTGDDGGALLRTSDTTCTYPAIPAEGEPFRPFGYDGSFSWPTDGGPTDITRTREGSIELIVGADIIPGSPTDLAITHSQDETGSGPPPACETLFSSAVLPDLVAPTSGIYGSGSIVDVGEGTFFGYGASALQGFTDAQLFTTDNFAFLTLQDANSAELGSNGGAIAYVSDEQGRPLVLEYESAIDAVSAVFMADSLYNEYFVDPSLGANTDWVVTFPTKRFYVDPALTPDVLPPFAELFDGVSRIDTVSTIYDREEGFSLWPDGCGEQCPPEVTWLPYQVNVVSFLGLADTTAKSGVFGSVLNVLDLPPYRSSGAVKIDLHGGGGSYVLPGGIDPAGNEVILNGLPVMGFMAYNVVNTDVQPGVLANYSAAFPHRTTTSCQGPADECGSTITD